MCACNGGNGIRRQQSFRAPSGSTRVAAAQVGASTQHEVLNASGKPTGRSFSSLVAAQGFARRIGGTTRPKR